MTFRVHPVGAHPVTCLSHFFYLQSPRWTRGSPVSSVSPALGKCLTCPCARSSQMSWKGQLAVPFHYLVDVNPGAFQSDCGKAVTLLPSPKGAPSVPVA